MLLPPSRSNAWRGRWQLCAALVILAATWLVILPAIGDLTPIQQVIAENAAAGVDPGAKFYTEVPAARGAIAGIDSLQRRKSEVLWSIGRK